MANSRDYSTFSEGLDGPDVARWARLTIRQAFTASLATVDPDTGYPYASLVSVAASALGEPILLLSGLARHTKNIAANQKSSLLFEAPLGGGDPLQAARVTVQGDIAKTTDDGLRQRYLARHPEASAYADFSDFAFYRMHVSSAHFIAGFGRIHTLAGDAVCLGQASPAEDLSSAVDLATFSKEHQDSLNRAWRQQVGSKPHGASLDVIAVDRDGLDVRSGEAMQRINFGSVIAADADLNNAIEALGTATKPDA